MLENLSIRDFQCHDRLKIEFDPAITTIVGSSDVGKSAVIRAIRWLCLNKPRGDGFIRHGTEQTTIQLQTTEGKVGRRKGKRGNIYRLNKDEFKSFGSIVPESIERMLRVDQVNFQGQHDPLYWFNLTPGELAKELNVIVDLSIIDEVVDKILSRHRKLKAEVELVENRLKAGEESLAALDYVSELDCDLKLLEELDFDLSSEIEQGAVLGTLLDGVGIIDQSVGRLQMALSEARTTLSVGLSGVEIANRTNGLVEILQEVRDSEECACIDIPHSEELEESMEVALDLSEEVEDLFHFLEELEEVKQRVELKVSEWEEAMEQFLEETEGLCPICGGDLKC